MAKTPDLARRRLQYVHVKKARATLKKRLVACFGGACAICGLRDDPIIYDFHHINPLSKRGLLTGQIKSWEWVVEESANCAMLCAHCHRKIHVGLVSLPQSTPRFNPELIEGTELEVGRGTDFNACPVCGKRKSIKNRTCSHSCARRKYPTFSSKAEQGADNP